MVVSQPELSIRHLLPTDISVASAILKSAFGGTDDRRIELGRYLAIEPDGWLLAERGGQPVGTVGAVDYGPFAYLGLLGVIPEAQGQGIGRALMRAILRWLDARGCPLVLLDASETGASVYPSLGFVDDGFVGDYRRTKENPLPECDIEVKLMTAEDLPGVARMDAPIFGAPRDRVIAAYLAGYPSRAFLARDEGGEVAGYLIAQFERIGPWIATTPEAACALLSAALRLDFSETPRVNLPEDNRAEARLLKEAGFTQQRALRHMRRGSGSYTGQRDQIYALASFAIG